MSYSKLKLSLQSGNHVVSYQCQLTERLSVLGALASIAQNTFDLPCYLWNLGSNTIAPYGSEKLEVVADFNSSTNPFAVLQFLIQETSDGVFILENLHPFLAASSPDVSSQVTSVRLVSQVTSLAFDSRDSQKFIILLSTAEQELPPALSSVVPEFIHPLPTYEDNVALLYAFLPSLDPALDTSIIPELAVSAGGLSTEEIKSGLRYSFHLNGGKLTSDVTQNLLDYKIDRLKAFNLAFTAPPNVKNFGGVTNIRNAIHSVKKRYSHEARQRGIPLPKGWLFVGPPGTGKTFVSKFCASILGFPMINVPPNSVLLAATSVTRR